MTSRRVFVIWSHPIFHESLRLLLNHPGIEWVGATSDHRAAHEAILRHQPDTVLLEEGEDEEVPCEAVRIIGAGPTNVRVIRLSLSDNELSVYHRERRTIGAAEELLQIIQGD